MANYTPNYQLHQWAPEDKFLRTDFNEDLNKIDTALGKHEQLTTSHEAAIARLGNCQLYCTTYEGNGITTKPRSYTFPAKPLVVFVTQIEDGRGIIAPHGAPVAVLNFSTSARLDMTWSERSVSWYYDSFPEYSLNMSGKHYQLIALLDMEK